MNNLLPQLTTAAQRAGITTESIQSEFDSCKSMIINELNNILISNNDRIIRNRSLNAIEDINNSKYNSAHKWIMLIIMELKLLSGALVNFLSVLNDYPALGYK